jgi:hypothetical protein
MTKYGLDLVGGDLQLYDVYRWKLLRYRRRKISGQTQLKKRKRSENTSTSTKHYQYSQEEFPFPNDEDFQEKPTLFYAFSDTPEIVKFLFSLRAAFKSNFK